MYTLPELPLGTGRKKSEMSLSFTALFSFPSFSQTQSGEKSGLNHLVLICVFA